MTFKKLLTMAAAIMMAGSMWAQKDVTSTYITNAKLSDGTNGWTVVNFNTPQKGNNTEGYASEAYAGWGALEKTEYSMTQKITLPAGNYTLVNYSFYREGENANTDAATSRAVLKAGDKSVAIKTLGSITAGGYANSQAEGANVFDSKMYRNALDFKIDADGTEIEIGITGTFTVMRSWIIAGMFELINNDIEATMDSPFDVTGYITNPGFEYRDMTGWTLSESGAFGTQNNNQSFKRGGYYAQAWQSSSAGALTERSMSQKLSDLPAGYYQLKVNIGGNGAYVDLNGKTANWTEDKDYTVGYVLSDGEDLTIKAGKTAEGTANWIHFDNFRLYYCGDVTKALTDVLAKVTEYESKLPTSVYTALQTKVNAFNKTYSDVDELLAAIDAVQLLYDTTDEYIVKVGALGTSITSVSALLEKPMNADVKAEMQALILKYKDKEMITLDEVNAAIAEVNPVVIKVQESIVTYEEIAEWNALADANLNTTGKETYAAILNAYNNRTATESNSAKETYLAQVKAANLVENADLTSLIVNPSFETGNHNGWSIEGSNDTGAKDNSNGTYTMSKVDGKYVFNTWSVGNPISQTITDMPTGVYTLTAVMGTDGGKTLEITGNGTTGSFASVDKGTGVDVSVDFNCIDGNINISAGTLDKYWYKVDNFKLYFVKAINLNDLYDEIDNLVADAKAITSTSTGITNELTAVIAKGEAASHTETDFDKLGNVIDELKAAISKANAYNAADVTGYLNKMKGVLDNTNVYTAEAYSKWYGDVESKYANAEYTTEEVSTLTPNGAYTGAYKPVNKIDEVLLSAWTIGGAQAKDYDKALYINTWSIEANDKANGSGMYTPFFEYWTSDGNSLGATDLVATVEGVTPGTYKVEALVRVRIKNDNTEDAHGITLKANDGATVDICAGATCDDGAPFRYGKFAAIAEVASDGVLKITISIAAENNISWISYRDVKYAEADEATLAVSAANEYATFVAPFDVTIPAGVKAYTVDGVTGTDLDMTEVTTTIPANTPVVLQATTDVNEKFYGAAVAGDPEAGLLTGVYTDTPAPVGTYVLQNQGEVKFYLVEAGAQPTVKAGHAYLTAPSAGVKAFGFDAIATAIAKIEAEKAQKAGIYNLQGQQLNSLQRGINIVNGKKVLVK